MRRHDRELLLRILAVQSYSRDQEAMTGLMVELLVEAGMDVVVHDGQVYGRKGDTSLAVPYFVAHQDTVHRVVPEEHYQVTSMMTMDGDIRYRAIDPTTGDPRGVGGDDKCGLYACVIAAQSLDNVGVLITRDEEIGCVGASMTLEELLIRPGCFIQLDRRGNDDAVYNIGGPISSQAWMDEMEPILAQYGYAWSYGSITDVGTLSEMMLLSAVNLSAGYWRPHSENEYISETDLEIATELALHIAEVAGNQVWDIPASELNKRSWTIRKSDGTKITYAHSDPYSPNWKPRPTEPKYTLYNVDTFIDPFVGEAYRQYVVSVEAEKTLEIIVPVDNPHDWELSDTKYYTGLSEAGYSEIETAVLRNWHLNVEPQLAIWQQEQDTLCDVEEPELEWREGNPLETEWDLQDGIKDTVGKMMREHTGSLCDVPFCKDGWYAYDISTRAWMCEEHYKEHAEDDPVIQQLTLQVAEMARKIRADSGTKHQIMEMHAKDIVLHEGQYIVNPDLLSIPEVVA